MHNRELNDIVNSTRALIVNEFLAIKIFVHKIFLITYSGGWFKYTTLEISKEINYVGMFFYFDTISSKY